MVHVWQRGNEPPIKLEPDSYIESDLHALGYRFVRVEFN